MTWRVANRNGASGYGVARSGDCDASLTRPGAAAQPGRLRSGKVLVSGMRELHHSTLALHDRAWCGTQRADARVAPTLRRQLCGEARHAIGVHREAQLVVVAAGERELTRALGAECGAQ